MDRDITAQLHREQLHRAAEVGDLTEVERLIVAGYPINRFDYLGRTPLHYAVAGEHLAIVDILLRAGANVNASDEQSVGNTPLGEYAGSCSFAMAKRLIDAGADATIPGWMQLTALNRAERRKDSEGAKILTLLRLAAKQNRRRR